MQENQLLQKLRSIQINHLPDDYYQKLDLAFNMLSESNLRFERAITQLEGDMPNTALKRMYTRIQELKKSIKNLATQLVLQEKELSKNSRQLRPAYSGYVELLKKMLRIINNWMEKNAETDRPQLLQKMSKMGELQNYKYRVFAWDSAESCLTLLERIQADISICHQKIEPFKRDDTGKYRLILSRLIILGSTESTLIECTGLLQKLMQSMYFTEKSIKKVAKLHYDTVTEVCRKTDTELLSRLQSI